jgi:hypothetical protein
MKSWNCPDHTIADTEHGTLHFTGDITVVIADWEVSEDAPDSDGRVYAQVRGWLVNGGGTGRHSDPYAEPIEAGRARLLRTELRGRQPVTDRDIHLSYYNPGQPHPNTWDHRGTLVTISWMDRRIDANGQPVPETEIGLTQWTDPATGTIWDLTRAYVPKGEFYYDLPEHAFCTWQHFDRWSGGVPVLHRLYDNHKTPSGTGIRLTDGEWTLTTEAPKWSEAMSRA